MNKFNIIFPMAGEGSRFNYIFKPFIKISDQTFIELAYKFFKPYQNQIIKIYFIITQEQNIQFNVEKNLKEYFSNYELIILEKKTKGPYQTILQAIKSNNIQGASFICDCDHSINISPIIDNLNNLQNYDVILPIWNLKNEDINSWSKVYLDANQKVIGFSEKELLDISDIYYGIIGCIYFKNVDFFNSLEYENISQGLQQVSNITTVKINQAEFFGDPVRLNKTIEKRRNSSTIFCDLDGTLIIHEANPDYKSTKLLPGTLEQINYWKENNYFIIITTARNNREKLEKLLNSLNIYYDILITGLSSGPRYLINDIKPVCELVSQANSINLIRNQGIQNINIKYQNYELINILKGNSFSKTIIIKKDNKICVRKYIYKNDKTYRHYKKLKRQYNDILRFNSYLPNICPELFDEYENDYLYYYDMKYLENYNTINKIIGIDLNILYNMMYQKIYSINKINNNCNWISDYLKKKINISAYEKLHPDIKELINLPEIKINGVDYIGIKQILKQNFNHLNPKYLSIIHGDLTFENILYNKDNNDFKLIDMDGSEYIDAPELDFGKILQSLLSKYEQWSNCYNPIIKIDINNHELTTLEFNNLENYNHIFKNLNIWHTILNTNNDMEILKQKGIFFMCTHLLRIIPYRYKISLQQAIYAIKEVIIWFNQII